MMNRWLWGGLAVCLLIIGRCAAHQRHPILTILGSAVCGLGTLALLGLLAPVTGVTLPLNRFTGGISVLLGMPGVILLLLLQLLL